MVPLQSVSKNWNSARISYVFMDSPSRYLVQGPGVEHAEPRHTSSSVPVLTA